MLMAGFAVILMLMVTVIYKRSHANQLDRAPDALALAAFAWARELHRARQEASRAVENFLSPLAFALALAAGFASPAAAQSVNTSDVQRLQDRIYDASRAVTQLRQRDPNTAAQLQAELDDLSDEAIYLKVKLRKNEPVGRREFAEVRDHVDSVGNRARNGDRGGWVPGRGAGTVNDDRPVSSAGAPYPPEPPPPPPPPPPPARSQNPNEIPVGTEFDVRLQATLTSKTSEVEDRFDATNAGGPAR